MRGVPVAYGASVQACRRTSKRLPTSQARAAPGSDKDAVTTSIRGAVSTWLAGLPSALIVGLALKAGDSQKRNQHLSNHLNDVRGAHERVSEVDLMSDRYPLSFHRRIERQWAEWMKSLGLFGGQLLVATERTLQRAFNDDGSPIPVPVRTVVDRRRREQYRSHD